MKKRVGALVLVLTSALAGVVLALMHALYLGYSAPIPGGVRAGGPFMFTEGASRWIVVPAVAFGIQQYDVAPDTGNYALNVGSMPRWVLRPVQGQSSISRGFGWPFVACSGTEVYASQRIISTPGYFIWKHRFIPTLVRPGLAGNSLVFAAGIFVLLSAGKRVARKVRGRRQPVGPACRSCGYDLTGLAGNPCPECGTRAEQS